MVKNETLYFKDRYLKVCVALIPLHPLILPCSSLKLKLYLNRFNNFNLDFSLRFMFIPELFSCFTHAKLHGFRHDIYICIANLHQ